MPHVIVVTRNPSIAVGLTHHGYEVTDVRPDRHGDWARQAIGTQAVVLELSDPVAADAAIRRLRADGNGVQVLVVSNGVDGWDEVVAHAGPGVRALPLPITLPSLMAAIEEQVAAGPVDVPPPPRNEEELLSAVARQVGLTISDTGTLVSDVPVAESPRAPEPVEEPPPVEEDAPVADAPRAPEPLAEPPPVEEDPPVADAPRAPEPLAEPPPVEEDPPVAEGRAAAEAPPARPHAEPGAEALVLSLLAAAAGRFSTVAETAEIVAADLAERLGAGAAVLLAEGDAWTVAATSNIDGAGLARWPEPPPYAALLTVPIAGGVLVAAREEAFGDGARAAAEAVAETWAPMLREAVAVRALARALAPYAG